jgi:hypothetical protein
MARRPLSRVNHPTEHTVCQQGQSPLDAQSGHLFLCPLTDQIRNNDLTHQRVSIDQRDEASGESSCAADTYLDSHADIPLQLESSFCRVVLHAC